MLYHKNQEEKPKKESKIYSVINFFLFFILFGAFAFGFYVLMKDLIDKNLIVITISIVAFFVVGIIIEDKYRKALQEKREREMENKTKE